MTNVYVQLNRLIEDGLVIRTEKNYKLSEKALLLLSGEQKTSPTTITVHSDKDIEEFRKFSATPSCLKDVLENFAPHILGLPEAKLSVLLSMLSLNDNGSSKNRTSVLLKGDSSTGKTSLIKWAFNNLWGFYSDTNTKKSGFRGGVMGYQYKPGLLQKADNSVLFIDELDKFEPSDLDALLGAMQDGRVFIHLDKVDKETETNIRVVASCNNEQKLKQELLSRFDLVIDLKHLSEDDKIKLVNRKANDWNREANGIDVDFLTKYLQYCKEFEVKLPEDRSKISNILVNEIKHGCLQGKDIRKIESIFRISLSLAKLFLSPEVTDRELKLALTLIKRSVY